MKIFRVAIIGLGRIGFEYGSKIDRKYILSYAGAFRLHGGFELAAGFDINEKRIDAFQRKYRVPGYHYRDMKKHLEGMDAVVIAAPAEGHFEIFKDVIASCKPRILIMEKPLSFNLKQAREIVLLSKKNSVPLYVNYFRRVDPGVANLKKLIDRKKRGRLRFVDIYYGRDILNNGSHFIDLMLYLLGNPESIRLLRRTGKKDIDFVFYYKQLLVFFRSSFGISYYLKDMDFVFERARVRYSNLSATQLMLPGRASDLGIKELKNAGRENLYLDVQRCMSTVASHIYNVLSGKSELISTGETALQTLEVCFDILNRRTKV